MMLSWKEIPFVSLHPIFVTSGDFSSSGLVKSWKQGVHEPSDIMVVTEAMMAGLGKTNDFKLLFSLLITLKASFFQS